MNNKEEEKVYFDGEAGFIRSKRLLSRQAWDEYYRDKYFQEVKPTYIVEKKQNCAWEELHFKRSKDQFIKLNPNGKSLLDIGCAYGGFIYYLNQFGFETEGVEPSNNFIGTYEEMGLKVHSCPFEDFSTDKKYDFVNLSYVLEHVLDPGLIIQKVRKLLNPGGIIRIEVPNDFNPLQISIVENMGLKKWWIADEHLNYFNHKTLANFLTGHGFSILYQTATFPMEQHILMGMDYITNPDLGPECHKKRVNFEMNLSNNNEKLLWDYYDQLVHLGLGRESIIYGKM